MCKQSSRRSTLLRDYSPWLANYNNSEYEQELEVPGQYTGDKRPLPQFHAKISAFLPEVLNKRYMTDSN